MNFWLRRCGLLLFALALTLPVAAPQAQTTAMGTRPQLRVQTLSGKIFDLASARGRWVIVNFWATWCKPCISEMPAISKFVATHKEVTAIGVAWDKSPRADIVKFAHRYPVVYPLAQVATERAPGGFPAPLGLPVTYLVAPDGRKVRQFLGPVDASVLAQAIAEAKTEGATSSAAKPSAAAMGH